MNGREIGRVRRGARSRLSFTYAEDWCADPDAYPLSVSMPLSAAEHTHAPIVNFLWGLLPDNALVLEKWASRFHVSPSSPFALIANVGEDCAGAAQFVVPERLDAVLGSSKRDVEWVTDADIAQRLKALRMDHSAWRAPRDTGQFSLAGAQPKTALLRDGNRWGVPSGRTPTTHILKPPTGEFDGHAENEHFCLRLARAVGLPTATSEVMRFEDELAIVVERYDRVVTKEGILRAHQEDMCQALALHPAKKYENEGGPGAKAIVTLLRDYSSARGEDVATFLDAFIFNWLIAGSDAHAKNYSLLIGAGGRVRLAPLYDLASALPYDALNTKKLKLAMKVGKKYRLADIGPRDWSALASEVGVKAKDMRDRVLDLIDRVEGKIEGVRSAVIEAGIRPPVIDLLVDRLRSRLTQCRRLFLHQEE
ncbi:MAG: type II toxin-antitoxin system HipA family toxin [Rhodospirillaceae bacterium]|nr:type II toxin-antitoxin system HipA family toxin [Rhodospirillaceae bacterium]